MKASGGFSGLGSGTGTGTLACAGIAAPAFIITNNNQAAFNFYLS
jgi:hypothetical protein